MLYLSISMYHIHIPTGITIPVTASEFGREYPHAQRILYYIEKLITISPRILFAIMALCTIMPLIVQTHTTMQLRTVSLEYEQNQKKYTTAIFCTSYTYTYHYFYYTSI